MKKLFYLLVPACLFAGCEHGREKPRLPAEPVDQYVHALGEAVQGLDTLAVKQQFTKGERVYLQNVRFVSSPAIMDFHQEDTITDVEQCKVSRVTSNFAGVKSKAQIVASDPNIFWRKIKDLAEYRKSQGAFPLDSDINSEVLQFNVEHQKKVSK